MWHPNTPVAFSFGSPLLCLVGVMAVLGPELFLAFIVGDWYRDFAAPTLEKWRRLVRGVGVLAFLLGIIGLTMASAFPLQ
jgi:hypothetical protein